MGFLQSFSMTLKEGGSGYENDIECRRKHSLSSSRVSAGALGRRVGDKNGQIKVEIMACCRRRHPPSLFVVGGV